MKIAFFGTGDFSRNIFEWLCVYSDIDIALVVSAPDKAIGRKQILTETPLKKSALLHHKKVLQPEKIKNNEELFSELEDLNLDFIIVVAYGKIVPKRILDIPKYGCINIHGSLLPLYRWASPIQESLKNGDKETGLTIMYMSEGMDEGDILSQAKIKVDKDDKTPDIFKKFESFWPELLYTTLKDVEAWKIKAKKQEEEKATYCKKIRKEDGEIDFKKMKWDEIYNLYRAYYPWPWIYTFYNEKKLNIETCFLYDWAYSWSENIIPWKIVKIDKKNIWIVASDKKILILWQVKLEWKKSMDIFSFVNGNKEVLEYSF